MRYKIIGNDNKMKKVRIKELALKFKANLFIAKVRDKINSDKKAKENNDGFTRDNSTDFRN